MATRHKSIAAMERARTVDRLLGQTPHGDSRPAYRNLATGKLSFPVKSAREIEADSTGELS